MIGTGVRNMQGWAMVKVNVRSSIIVLSRDVVELKDSDATLRKLLIGISQGMENGVQLINPGTGDMYGPFVARLNGEMHNFLLQGLDTRLEDGDTVEITQIVVGGG